MSKQILFLGGDGFIGRNLAEYFSSKYDCYSVGIKKSIFLKNRKDKFIKINPYKEKIKNNYNIIIHLVDNKIDLKYFIKEEKELIKNIGLNKKNHLILFSSAVVYANPDSEYGKRKISLEEIYKKYCAKNKINLTVFRLFNTYGQYQLPNRQGCLVANILVNHLNKKTTQIKDINAKRDFIFSGDIGKIAGCAISHKKYGTFDLSSNKLVSIKEILTIIESVAGESVKIDDRKEREQIKSPARKNKLLKEIKLLSLKEGIEKSLNFYRNNLEIINKINK